MTGTSDEIQRKFLQDVLVLEEKISEVERGSARGKRSSQLQEGRRKRRD